MKVILSPQQQQLESETVEEKELKTTSDSINKDGFYPYTEFSIYVEAHEELCFVLSSN